MNTLRFIAIYLRKDILQNLSYRTSIVLNFVGLLIMCLLYFYLAKIVDTADPKYLAGFGGEYFPYFILGMGIYRFTQNGLALFVRALLREAASGTLEFLWLGRMKPLTLMFSMSFGPFLSSFMGFLGLVIIGCVISPTMISKLSLPAMMIAVTLAYLCYFAVGLLVIGVSLVTKRGQGLVSLFGFLNLILAGVIFPKELLPEWLQTIAFALPLTHILELARVGIYGTGGTFALEALYFMILIVFLYPLALFGFHHAVRKVEEEGSLAHF